MYKLTADDIDFCDAYSYILCRRLGKPRCDDALQTARLGLVIASHEYDPGLSDNFKGYATWHIRSTLYRDHFGMNCTKKDAMGANKSVSNYEDVCYSIGIEIEKDILDRDLVEKCLAAMTLKQQKIIKAIFLEDKDISEYARETGQTPQNIRLRMTYAKNRCRRKFKREVF